MASSAEPAGNVVPGGDFDAFVLEAASGLLRIALLLTHDRGHAEDMVQTALLRTARRWRSARSAPLAYTRRVLVNLAKDRARNVSRRAHEVSDQSAVPEPSCGDSADQIVLRALLVDAARALPMGQRAILVLRFFEDLSVDETAAVLGCSAGTVKSQTHAAMAKLRTELAQALEVPTRASTTAEAAHAG